MAAGLSLQQVRLALHVSISCATTSICSSSIGSLHVQQLQWNCAGLLRARA